MSPIPTFETIRYETDAAVAVITLCRPDAANAQDSTMIEELDAAFDCADADDEVRVVVVAGEGKHFSAGHDLKEILEATSEWARLRDTPEGKLHHEQVMYWDKLVRIRDFRKPTISPSRPAQNGAAMRVPRSSTRRPASGRLTRRPPVHA